jgi:TonB-dependent SusC/RagA subfamily outer membrane receptor
MAGVGLEVSSRHSVSRGRKAIGYAVQEVSGRTITDANTVSAIDALAGSAAGLQVTSSSGSAGAASRIILRGQTSFNGNNEALIVVDGVRLNNDENHSERSLAGVNNSNRAIDLNPNDIDKVTILKGAAATALYGIEGARGVILITTKKGKGKGLTVDVSTGLTISEITT